MAPVQTSVSAKTKRSELSKVSDRGGEEVSETSVEQGPDVSSSAQTTAKPNEKMEKAKELAKVGWEKVKGPATEKAKELGKKGFKGFLTLAKNKVLPKGKELAGKAIKSINFKKVVGMIKK